MTAFPLNIISKAAEKNAQEFNGTTLSLDSNKLVSSALGSSDFHYYSDDVDAVLQKIGKGNDYSNTTYTSSPIMWKAGAVATNLALLKGTGALADGALEAIPELSSLSDAAQADLSAELSLDAADAGLTNAGADALLNGFADSDASLSAAGAQGLKFPVDNVGNSGYAGSGNPIIDGIDAFKQARTVQPALPSYTGSLPISDVASYLTKVIGGNGAGSAEDFARQALIAKREADLDRIFQVYMSGETDSPNPYDLLKKYNIPSAISEEDQKFKDTVGKLNNVTEGTGDVVKNLKPQNLMDELAQSGVKFNPDDVVTVVKTPDSKLLWLENGDSASGLQHIVDGHAADFANRGINDIPGFLSRTLQETPVKAGINKAGPYAEYLIDGRKYRVAYGTNGYIVSFYPLKH